MSKGSLNRRSLSERVLERINRILYNTGEKCQLALKVSMYVRVWTATSFHKLLETNVVCWNLFDQHQVRSFMHMDFVTNLGDWHIYIVLAGRIWKWECLILRAYACMCMHGWYIGFIYKQIALEKCTPKHVGIITEPVKEITNPHPNIHCPDP